MTIEEKAKAYDEALEQAKFYHGNCPSEPERKKLEKMFPELRESEDERVRKELLEEIEFIIPHDDETDSKGLILPSYHARIDRYKSYLEKQKEVKWSPSECEMGVLYKLCYVSNQITDEDDTELTRLYQDLKREYFNGHSFENMFPKEKQKEQKPVVTHGETYHVDTLGTQQVIAGKMPQKPAEWSEEDKGLLERAISIIGWAGSCTDKYKIINPDGAAELQKFLKSLRPQPQWKPSKEQMNALKVVAHGYPSDDIDAI